MSRRPKWWLAFLAKIWPITWNSARATQWPVIGPVIAALTLPLFSGKNLNISYLPINEGVDSPGSTPLPLFIVEELIRRASYHTIIHKCTCRDAKQCTNHPVEYGCIHLGMGASEEDTTVARHVTADQAMAHLHKGVAHGLIPMVGRVKIDNLIWGVRDRGRLLTVCLCCRCCCTILASGKYLPQRAADSIKKLRGLRIKTDTGACTCCGVCVNECFMGAISMTPKGVVIDHDRCRGCGRCAAMCLYDALSVQIDDVDAAVDEVLGRIGSVIDYTTPGRS